MAQAFGEIDQPPLWTQNNVGTVHFRTLEAARQFQCLRSCYLRCVERFPNSAWGCRGVSEECCLRDFFCAYCGR